MDDLSRRSGGRRAKSVVFTAEQIAARVASLGREITSAYPDGDLVLLGLLKGSFIFLADLADFAAVNQVYGGSFPATPPARATVQVAALPRGARVEIDAVAGV